MSLSAKYEITAELLSVLESERYNIGVGEYLQIQTLLKYLPNDATENDLKNALVPLIAKNKIDQERLQTTIDKIIKDVKKEIIPPNPPNFWQKFKDYHKKNKFKSSSLFALLFTIILVPILLYLFPPKHPSNNTGEVKIEQQNQNQVETKTETKTETEYPFVKNKPYPFPKHLEDYSYKPPKGMSAWMETNWRWARWLLAVNFTALLIGFWQWIARRNQKSVIEQNQNDKPPYFWNINLKGIDKNIFDAQGVKQLSIQLRHRSKTDNFRIDIEKTINATIAQGGSPKFLYKNETSTTDYVLLIDRQSIRNHRARLFNELYEALKAQEVEITRFFYDSDVRVCFNETYPNGISISDIQQRYYTARLMLIGTGAQLLSPLSGKLAKWTDIFEQFNHRALFSPRSIKLWGFDEKQLANLFTTLPATLKGLNYWIEAIDDDTEIKRETWQTKITDAPNASITPDDANPIPTLQAYFNNDLIEWIAACAIYPSLHFDLTLWLGQQLSTKDNKLCNYENLSKIFRLSWFVQAEMPNETRVALLEWFEQRNATKLLNLRGTFAAELNKNPPPIGSVAYKPFRMNMAVNEWLSSTDKKKKKELEQEIALNLAKGVETDFTVIKYLDKPQKIADLIVQNGLKNYVNRRGNSEIVWLKEYSYLRWLLPIWLISMVVLFWYHTPKTTGCNKENLVHYVNKFTKLGSLKDYSFCLDDEKQKVVYFEYTLRDTFYNGNYAIADKLITNFGLKNLASLDSSKDILLNSICRESAHNSAVDFYNIAENLYNRGSDSSCYYLNLAYALDSTNDTITRAQRIVCKVPSPKEKPIVPSNYSRNENTVSTNSTIPSNAEIELKKLFGNKRTLEGIDISHYNGDYSPIDFDFIAKNYAFVYVKSSDGTSIIDSKFKENFKALTDRKILCGAYHFFRITNSDVQGQIDNFLNAGIDYNQTGILPPVLDIADAGSSLVTTANKNEIIARIHTWLDAVENKTGKTPIIYTSRNIWDNILQSPTGFERYPLWVGSYTTGSKPFLPATWNNYLFWQYTEEGVVNGKRNFDINRTSLTYQELINLTYSNFKNDMVFVQGGTFTMGDDTSKYIEEKPAHQVTISDFYIGKTEVTQAQWRAVMGSDPVNLRFKGCDDCPVESVSWNDVQDFFKKLNAKSNHQYRLPTEAEWEFAARGGVKSKSYKYSGSNNLDEVAWHDTNSGNKTHPVSMLNPNELGIYDMSGNVWEWCNDWFDQHYYEKSPYLNPKGSITGNERVMRGGSFYLSINCRVAFRYSYIPANPYINFGFRVSYSK